MPPRVPPRRLTSRAEALNSRAAEEPDPEIVVIETSNTLHHIDSRKYPGKLERNHHE